MMISVIVIAYNAQDTIEVCLRSLLDLDFPAAQREIIVVDNGSHDATKEIILRHPVRYDVELNRGRGWARNKGIAIAQGEYVAFTDTDCIVDKHWLKNLVQSFEGSDHLAACGGRIRAFNQKTIFERYAEERGTLSQRMGINGKYLFNIPRIVTANAIFLKSVLKAVGCFDEDLITSEDTEVSWRISLAGYEIRYIPEAVVYHQHRKTFREFCRHHFDFGRASAVINQKYRKWFLGITKPSTILGVLPRSMNLFLILTFEAIKELWVGKRKRKEEILFPLLDVVAAVSFDVGYLFVVIGNARRNRKVFQSKIPIEKFSKTLRINDAATRWLLNGLSTWFLNNGTIRLISLSRRCLVYQFNKTATEIWLNLVKTGDIDQTAKRVASYYGVSKDRVVCDIKELLVVLEKENFLKKSDAPLYGQGLQQEMAEVGG